MKRKHHASSWLTEMGVALSLFFSCPAVQDSSKGDVVTHSLTESGFDFGDFRDKYQTMVGNGAYNDGEGDGDLVNS